MSNKNPTSKGASKNLSKILNPKAVKIPRQEKIKKEILGMVFGK